MNPAIVLLLLLLFMACDGAAQKMPADYFQEGVHYAGSEQYGKAIESFKYIVDKHPKNELYPESFYNLAYCYYQAGDYANSIRLFRTIIAGSFNDKDEIGGDIMAAPYANYKYRASDVLCTMYYEQQQYDSSLYYLNLSDTAFPFQHFCGNAHDDNEKYKALKYANLYQKAGQPKKAVPYLLNTAFSDFGNDQAVMKQLAAVLKKLGIKKVKAELDKAIAGVYTKKDGRNENNTNVYFMHFLETELEVPGTFDGKELTKQKVMEEIKSSNFYRVLSGLRD